MQSIETSCYLLSAASYHYQHAKVKLHVFSLCLKSIMKSFLILVVSLLLIGFVNGDPLECPEENFELVGNTIGTANNVTLWKACGETLNHTTP